METKREQLESVLRNGASAVDDGIEISLNRDEAIVFFEWLSRTEALGNPAPYADQAEQRVLWDIQAVLESEMTEPFSPTYAEVVESARARLRDAAD